MKRNLTCIVCPMGCSLEIEYEGKELIGIKGNTCKRGAEYAKNEFTNPVRTVTSTVKCENGDVVSVKTDRPISKSKLFECMELINKTVVKLPVSVGDVVLEDVFGCNIVATQNKAV